MALVPVANNSMMSILNSSLKAIVPVSEIVSALNLYGRTFKMIVPVGHVVHQANIVKFGSKPALEVVRLMKMGKFSDAMFHIYKVRNVPAPMLNRLNLEMSHLPIYDLNNHANSALQLANKFTDLDAKNVKISDVQKNRRLKRMLNYMSSKKFVSFSGLNVAIGVGALAAFFAITNHQKKTSGCFRYSKVNGKFEVCKVADCSCENGKMMIDRSAYHCGPNIHIPKEMIQQNNCKNVTGMGCVNCPIEKSEGSQEDDDDAVIYRCNLPNFFEATADILNDNVNSVIEKVVSVGHEIGSFISIIFIVAKFMIIVIPIIFLIFWTYSKYNNARPKENHIVPINGLG